MANHTRAAWQHTDGGPAARERRVPCGHVGPSIASCDWRPSSPGGSL